MIQCKHSGLEKSLTTRVMACKYHYHHLQACTDQTSHPSPQRYKQMSKAFRITCAPSIIYSTVQYAFRASPSPDSLNNANSLIRNQKKRTPRSEECYRPTTLSLWNSPSLFTAHFPVHHLKLSHRPSIDPSIPHALHTHSCSHSWSSCVAQSCCFDHPSPS